MAAYVLGNLVHLATTTKVGGVLTDPTTITLQVRTPDAATTTLTPVRDSTGTYHYDYTPTLAGRHLYRWVSTGAAAAAGEGEFEVTDAWAAPGLISLSDAHQIMNIPAAATANDVEVQAFIDAATAIVEHITGPMTPQTFTEVHDGGRPYIMLNHYPVLAVTSVTEYSGTTGTVLAAQTVSAQTGNDYLLDATIGQLRRMASGSPSLYLSGTQNVVVVYSAGRASVPAPVRFAAMDLVRVLYQRTQLGGRPQGRPTGDEGTPGEMVLGYLVPNFVMEALVPYKRAPAVA